ncbi:MAG: hypothetical protein IKP86_11515 [Anaerolineaceae bacterium]|nr:hypothetical protein [Anaerolineaceae bacterium]
MFDYEKAITRPPCSRFAEGLTHGLLGKPDTKLAVLQHEKYVSALRSCGVEVINLPPDNDFPDSCFTEDEAIVTDRMAVIPSFCRPLRQGEEIRMRPIIEAFYSGKIEQIEKPGTLEGGDICRAGNHFFIGISSRTNEFGAYQFAEIVRRYGFTCDFCDIRGIQILHLTTGMSFIGSNTIVCCPAFRDLPAYKNYRVIVTGEKEAYAANCVRIRNTVIIPEGFSETEQKLRGAGFEVMTTPMSEIEKQDGGLSCLSIRIPKRI